MANEFIIKNGFQSKGDSQVTGSLTGTPGTINEFTSSYAITASHALNSGGSGGAFGISDSSGEYTYYSSLSASMAAAVSGDVVEVFADTVVSGSVALATTILFKNGVNIFGNGHTYTLDHSSSMAAFADFLEQNNTDATDISCSINEFNIRRISSDATSKAINIENRTSGKQTSLNLHGSTIHNTAGLAFRANYRNASVDGGHFYSDINGAAGFINANGGADTHPYTKNVNCHFPNGWSTVSSVDNSQFISEGDQSYTLTVTGRVSNCYVSSKGSGVTVLDGGTSSEILNCNIENVGSGIAVQGFGFVSNSTIYSNTSFAIRTLGSADCEIVNNRIYSKAYVALDQDTSYGGGRHNVSNNTIISDTSNTLYAAVQLQGANSNEFIFANNTVINNGDNANCHGIKLTNYDPSARRTILANNTIKVFNTGANCISTTSAVTNAFLAGNIYDVASVAVHPLITQSFTNVPDEQGNIHLTSSLNNNRIYSGSFSGSYVGDGSQLTGIDPFPFSGSAVIIGSLTISGSFNAFRIDSDDIVLGNEAGQNMSSTGASYNVLIGERAGSAITNGPTNVIIGREAGYLANQGRNTTVGYLAGRGWSNIAGENVTMGYYAGYNAATTGTGTHNTLLGAFAGRNLTNGTGNVYIGHSAGYQGAASTGNIIIGSGSLGAPAYGTPINNQLRIGNGDNHIISGSLETGHILLQTTTISGSLLNTGTVSIDNTDSPYTLTGTQQFVLIDPSGGDVTINMPDAATYPGREIRFKLTQAAGANTVTLQRQGADTIDGATTYTDLDIQYESISTVSNGSDGWFIF